MKKEEASKNYSLCNKSILRRKRAVTKSQKKVSTLFIYRDTHDHDEGCVEVCQDVPVDVEDGAIIFGENKGEAVTNED